jgi:hypothetical protein
MKNPANGIMPSIKNAKISEKIAIQKIFNSVRYSKTGRKIAELCFACQSTSTRIGTMLVGLFMDEINLPDSLKSWKPYQDVDTIDFTKSGSYLEVLFPKSKFWTFGLQNDIRLDNLAIFVKENVIDVYCLELTRGTRHNTRVSKNWLLYREVYETILTTMFNAKYPKHKFNLIVRYVPFDLDDLNNLDFHIKMSMKEKEHSFRTGIDICNDICKKDSYHKILDIFESKNEENVETFMDNLIPLQEIYLDEKKMSINTITSFKKFKTHYQKEIQRKNDIRNIVDTTNNTQIKKKQKV